MANTVPYIGSKISLISNSEIRYEGILYTINTQESTIALQSVKTFGTEGRKMPEIPPSSEVYDFIIFRGQDIKDLSVLEGAQSASSPMFSDPAIMSMNQRPAGGGPSRDGYKGGGKADSKGKASHDKGGGGGGGGKGWDSKGSSSWDSKGWDSKGSSKGMQSYDKGASWGGGYGGGRSDGWGKGGGKWDDHGKGRGGYDQAPAWGTKGKGKDQAKGMKGGGKGGKDDGKGYGKGKSKGDSGKGGGKGDRNRRGGKPDARGGDAPFGVPVGELLPEENAAAKKACADDFEFGAANEKFDKITESGDGEGEKKPLSGYSKTSSFFDNISCEATDRAADADRVKVDRDKARQYDKETFGDTRRPARPLGARRGKGKGKGGGKGSFRS